MFEYEGKSYSLEALQKSATSQGYNFEEFMQMYKDAGMTGDFSVLKGQKQTQQLESSAVKDIDTSPAGLFFNVLQQAQPTAAKPLAALASVAKGTVDIVDSMGDFAETMIEMEFSEFGGVPGTGLAPYMAKRIAARQAGVTKEEFDETNPYNVLKLKGLSNAIDKATIKHKDKETGQQLDFIELFEKGEYSKSAETFVYETAGALPSLLVSMIPGGYAMLGGSAFADKLNTDLFERPDQTAEKY